MKTTLKHCCALLLLVLPVSAFGFEFTTSLPAPKGTTPTIDGFASETEWHDAVRVELLGGGEMFLKHDGEYLYVLIRGERKGIASLCVERARGIAVLHASAALGTADYMGRTDNAKRTRQFQFELRDTSSSHKAREARQQFLADELWFANTTKRGSTIRELQISLEIADEYGRIPMAATFYMFDEDMLAYWPEDLSDDCLDLDLIKGSAPDKLDFQPHRWPVVTIEKCATPGDR